MISGSALEWAFELPLSTPSQKAVLLVLAKHADYKDQTCFPSLTTIARQACAHVRTVVRAINDLIRLGLVERVKSGSCMAATIYRVCVGTAPRILEKVKPRRPRQGDLFGSGAVSGGVVAQCHTNTPIEELQEKEREAPRSAFPASNEAPKQDQAEHITHGGLTFTVAEWSELERRLGGRLKATIESMIRYKATGRQIHSPYVAALKWRVSPVQPVVIDRRYRKTAQDFERFTPAPEVDKQTFNHKICDVCPGPSHQWKTLEPYTAESVEFDACPEFDRLRAREVVS